MKVWLEHNSRLCSLQKCFFVVCALLTAVWCDARTLVRAESVDGTPVYQMQSSGVDNVYLFAHLNKGALATQDGEYADWTDLTTGAFYRNYTHLIDLDDGHCYRIVQGADSMIVAVLDYEKHRLTNATLQVEMGCSNTTLLLTNLYGYTYNAFGQPKTVPYRLIISYQNQQWGEKDWETVTITDTIEVADPSLPIVLDSILCDTKFSIVEDLCSASLYGTPDSIVSDEYEAVAVAHHQQYFITMRGKKLENEKEGPYEDQTIIHSAPLNILFESHPSAKADVYTWTIRRGSDVYALRNDKDMRYIFDEASESGPVTYSVDLKVMNSNHPECVALAEDTITLNASMIMVPNVFTPNGDGANDEFRVVYRSICEFHGWIYNRWQHLIYSWDDPAKGWDGTYNGRKEPDSAYFYIIEAKGCDGRKFNLKGAVNLLRGK